MTPDQPKVIDNEFLGYKLQEGTIGNSRFTVVSEKFRRVLSCTKYRKKDIFMMEWYRLFYIDKYLGKIKEGPVYPSKVKGQEESWSTLDTTLDGSLIPGMERTRNDIFEKTL